MRRLFRICRLLVSLLLVRNQGVSEREIPTEEDIYAAMKQPPVLYLPKKVLQRVYSNYESGLVYDQIRMHLVWYVYQNLLYGVCDECLAYEVVVLYPDGQLVGFYRLER